MLSSSISSRNFLKKCVPLGISSRKETFFVVVKGKCRVRLATKLNLMTPKRHVGFPPSLRTKKGSKRSKPGTERADLYDWIRQMSEKKPASTRRAPASTPAGIFSIDGPVGLKAKQAPRPPAAAESNWRHPVILLAESRESVRVAFKKALDVCGCDVIVVEQPSEALSIAAAYDGHIDFFVTQTLLAGVNGGLLAHLFQRVHAETRVLFLSGSREEVLICEETLNHKVAVLEQPVGVDVVADKIKQILLKQWSSY